MLHDFCGAGSCTDGRDPQGPLSLDALGNLFGTTNDGGQDCAFNGHFTCGVVYKLAPNGASSTYTVLYKFCSVGLCDDGGVPRGGVIVDSLGNLFGTTEFGGTGRGDETRRGGGTVFELSGGTEQVLYSFCTQTHCMDGEYPWGGLVLDGHGNLFGTTSFGGKKPPLAAGTVFRVKP